MLRVASKSRTRAPSVKTGVSIHLQVLFRGKLIKREK